MSNITPKIQGTENKLQQIPTQTKKKNPSVAKLWEIKDKVLKEENTYKQKSI